MYMSYRGEEKICFYERNRQRSATRKGGREKVRMCLHLDGETKVLGNLQLVTDRLLIMS